MIDLKDYARTLPQKPVLVFGLGLTGLSLVVALKHAGVHVVVGDDNADTLAQMKADGFDVLPQTEDDFTKFSLLLLSPGVPLTHPAPHRVVKLAQAAGIDIICDIELLHRAMPDVKTIGITGTNGKSTTASLVQHILKKSIRKAVLGGNIGKPVFDLDFSFPQTIGVFELSSFQIDLCPTYRPDISVILNITPDHIDRHGDIETYAAVKQRLAQGGIVVIATDDSYTKKMFTQATAEGGRQVIEVSITHTPARGVFVKDGILWDALDGEAVQVGDLSRVQAFVGIHNHQNAACAYAAVRAFGLKPQEIWASMQSFPGLQHRQFVVRTINGVSYVNDSKATNAAAAAMALGCRNNIYWIVGGRKKKTGLDGLEAFFASIKHAFIIGETTDEFAQWFENYTIPYTRCYTLEKAVEAAHIMAQDNRGQPGGAGCVLLSPACASLDQYQSFEARGAHFETLVQALGEDVV